MVRFSRTLGGLAVELLADDAVDLFIPHLARVFIVLTLENDGIEMLLERQSLGMALLDEKPGRSLDEKEFNSSVFHEVISLQKVIVAEHLFCRFAEFKRYTASIREHDATFVMVQAEIVTDLVRGNLRHVLTHRRLGDVNVAPRV